MSSCSSDASATLHASAALGASGRIDAGGVEALTSKAGPLPRIGGTAVVGQGLLFDGGDGLSGAARLCRVDRLPHTREKGGVRALCTGNRSYRTQHTFRHANTRYTAPLVLCRAYTTARRTGRLKRRAVWLAYVAIACHQSPKKVQRRYRRRFGIETSYRVAGQVRAWTSSPNPAYRFLLRALGFILVNVWLHPRWLVAHVPRRGGRSIATHLLRLRRFRDFLIHAVEQRYGYLTEIRGFATPIL